MSGFVGTVKVPRVVQRCEFWTRLISFKDTLQQTTPVGRSRCSGGRRCDGNLWTGWWI